MCLTFSRKCNKYGNNLYCSYIKKTLFMEFRIISLYGTSVDWRTNLWLKNFIICHVQPTTFRLEHLSYPERCSNFVTYKKKEKYWHRKSSVPLIFAAGCHICSYLGYELYREAKKQTRPQSSKAQKLLHRHIKRSTRFINENNTRPDRILYRSVDNIHMKILIYRHINCMYTYVIFYIQYDSSWFVYMDFL